MSLSPNELSLATGSPLKLRILVVDDEESIRYTVGLFLESLGHRVQTVDSAHSALAAVQENPFDLALLDIRLGTADGIELMPRLLAANPRMKIIVITAYASVNLAVQAMWNGATDFLCKPFAPDQVGAMVSRAGELIALEHNVGTLQDRTGTAGPEFDFATTNGDMQKAVTLARQVSSSLMPVLILGETGTGKQVLARAIHGWGNRAYETCKIMNCADKSPEFVELALFGKSEIGDGIIESEGPTLLHESRGGTLIISRIEALPRPSQNRLARVLRQKDYQSADTPHAGTVRLLFTMDSNGTATPAEILSPDLAQLLDQVQIPVPALRRRANDIPMLAQRHLAYLRQLSGKTVQGFGTDAMDILQAYEWPGNLSELHRVVTAAVAQCAGDYVTARDVPPFLLAAESQKKRMPRAGDPITLDELEMLHIRAVIEKAPSLPAAADILGITQQSLYRRRKQFGI